MSKIILTGDRPTGRLHVGHYVGSLKEKMCIRDRLSTMLLRRKLRNSQRCSRKSCMWCAAMSNRMGRCCIAPVSYTHLDVYKRQ